MTLPYVERLPVSKCPCNIKLLNDQGLNIIHQINHDPLSCRYVTWLRENGLADKVPRMEPDYMNPSPWAEQEQYEIEFKETMQEVI
jgi:hypothetical protein